MNTYKFYISTVTKYLYIITPSLKHVVESLLSHSHPDKTNTFLSLSDWFFALVLFHLKLNDLFLSFLQLTFPLLPACRLFLLWTPSPSPLNLILCVFLPLSTSSHFISLSFLSFRSSFSLRQSERRPLPPLLLYPTLSFFCLFRHLNFLLCLTSLVSRLIPRKDGAKVLQLLLTSPFPSALSSPHHLPDFSSPPRAEFIFIEELFIRTKAQLFGSPLLLTLFSLCC